jgi:hypothetical protein
MIPASPPISFYPSPISQQDSLRIQVIKSFVHIRRYVATPK